MKRVLVISNDGLSDMSSNGRTMKQLLSRIDRNNIGQFCIHGVIDRESCNTFFQVSDRCALSCFLRPISKAKNCQPTIIIQDEEVEYYSKKGETVSGTSNRNIKRNCRNMLLREIVWCSYRWWTKQFDQWITDFHPEIIVFQAGDSGFMCDIVYRIVNKYKLPLLIYNSESYVIRKTLFHGADEKDIFHRIVKKRLDRMYDKLMSLDPYCVYITDELKEAYKKRYPNSNKQIALYTASTAEHYDYQPQINKPFTASYCGNLGGGRAEILVNFAKEMEQIDKTAKLIICGRDDGTTTINELKEMKNISFKGFVSYEEVQNVMRNSDLVLHCESNERIEARYYAFSTKIADCLRCGIPFMVLASEEYPFSQYLLRNKAAFVCGDTTCLRETLERVMIDIEYRCSCLRNAWNISDNKHNTENNARKFQEIIENS